MAPLDPAHLSVHVPRSFPSTPAVAKMAIMRVTDHRDFQALGQREVWESLRGTACIHSSIHSLLGSRSQKSQKMGTKVPSCFSKKTHVGGEKAGGRWAMAEPSITDVPPTCGMLDQAGYPTWVEEGSCERAAEIPGSLPRVGAGPSQSRYHLRLTRFKLLLLGLHLREEESRVRCEGSCLPAFHLSHLKSSSIFSLPPSI